MRSHRHGAPQSLRPKAARLDTEADARNLAIPDRADLLGPAGILRLQRNIGNAAVGALLEEERSPVHDVIRSGGSLLGAGIRHEMEARLGADFSDVRVHTDTAAHESAASVQAHAYTTGSHVVFQRGMYNPTSHAGKTMLAHELTHVTQQRSGAVDGTAAPGGIRLSDPSDRFERAASENANVVMSTPPPTDDTHSVGQGSVEPVQRLDVEDEEVEGEEEVHLQGCFLSGAEPPSRGYAKG
jgi:hypothetical protein